MRKKLKKVDGQRLRFRAIVKRFGTKQGYKTIERTILLVNVVHPETGQLMTDHIWFTVRKTIDALGLKSGDIVEFDARVKEYLKGYKGWDWEKQLESPLQTDYKLSHPTRFAKVGVDEQMIPEDED